MKGSSKQRIVGAFVLLALGLIFFPLLFDFSDQRRVDKSSTIPKQPDIQTVVIPEPQRPQNITPAKPDREIFQVDEKNLEETNDRVVEPALNEQGIPNAWIVQVASFRESKKAEDLVARLQSDGYKSFLQKAVTTSGTTYRVLVGPKIRKQAAVDEKHQIDRKYGSDALVTRFKP